MKVISPSFEILAMEDAETILKRIEAAGRTCYKSEDKITPVSAEAFVRRIIKSGHHSVLEHVSATVRLTCDRGVSHEIVRHRLASYSQESTRYCNYGRGNGLVFIKPCFLKASDANRYSLWESAMQAAEHAYNNLLACGATPQEARSVLPNSLKTEVVITANMREWRHIFKLRCDKAAHPQMRELMVPLLCEMNERCPVLFEDIYDMWMDLGQ